MKDSSNSPQLIAIAVVEHEGRYLIRRRTGDTPLAGYWEFPGGKMQLGETPEQAALRECEEETGLRVRAIESLVEVDHRYSHGALKLYFLHCQCETPHTLPGGGFQWVDGIRLGDFEFPAANERVLQILLGRERRRVLPI